MTKKIYTGAMGLFKFIAAILLAFKEPKAAATAVAMGATVAGGGVYVLYKVDAKHNRVMKEISANRVRVTSVLISQKEIMTKLDSIKDGINDTKEQVKDVSDKVWQIGRDVYILKKNGN